MSAGAAQVFVYYRVRAADAPLVIAAVRAAFVELQAALPGLDCRLSQRADEAAPAADLRTLMESYAHAAGVSAAMQGVIEAQLPSLLAAWIVGERHTERFAACA